MSEFSQQSCIFLLVLYNEFEGGFKKETVTVPFESL